MKRNRQADELILSLMDKDISHNKEQEKALDKFVDENPGKISKGQLIGFRRIKYVLSNNTARAQAEKALLQSLMKSNDYE